MTNFFVGQRSIGQSRVGTLGISVVKSDTRAKNLSDYFCFVCCQYHSTSAPCSYFIRHGRYVNLASDIFFIWHRYTRHRMGCLISSVIFSSGDAYSMFLRDVVAVYQRTLRHTREDPIWYWLRWELIISVWPLNLFRQLHCRSLALRIHGTTVYTGPTYFIVKSACYVMCSDSFPAIIASLNKIRNVLTK